MLVTALCLTRNRRSWLPLAIKCFLSQSVRNKELLVISDGEDVTDLIPAHESIRHFHLSGNAEIGEKRNLGCDLAAGEVIAHFDDDDVSKPGRLTDQLDRLMRSQKAVTGYSRMRFTDGTRWWQFSGGPDKALGTSLCYQKSWWERNRFRSIQIGEDNIFAFNASCAGQLSTADAGDLMYATIHPGNTSPRTLSGSDWSLLS